MSVYPELPPDLLRNCHAIDVEIDRVVLTCTGVYVRSKKGGYWTELKNLLEAKRPAIALNNLP